MGKPRALYIRAIALIGYAETVRGLGGDPVALLRRFELPTDPAYYGRQIVSCPRLVQLLEATAATLGNPDFSLLWSRNMQPNYPNGGSVALLGFFVRDFAEWIDLGIKYWNINCNAFTVRLVKPRDEPDAVLYRLVYAPGLPRSRQLAEGVLADGLGVARLVSGHTGLRPRAVRFAHDGRDDKALLEQMFDCPVQFNARHDEIVMDRSFLDLKTNGRLRLFRPFVERYIRREIALLPIFDQTIRETTRAALQVLIGSGNCNIAFVANSIGMSAKKLQRLLAQEETSFSEILTDVRREFAAGYLADSSIEISDVADLLDYASLSAFTNAFTRWQGMPPSAYRAQSEAEGARRLAST
jgi:AraC-like DNA-binding protein